MYLCIKKLIEKDKQAVDWISSAMILVDGLTKLYFQGHLKNLVKNRA